MSDTHSYIVRPISSEDVGGLLRLWRLTWTDTYGKTLGPEAVKTMLAGLNEHGASQIMPGTGERGYCALQANEMLGSVIFVARGSVTYLWGMYVHPDFQRRRVGTLLLQTVLKDAGKNSSIEVRALLSSPHAVSFYKKHGFTIKGEEDLDMFNGLKAQAVVMVWDGHRQLQNS